MVKRKYLLLLSVLVFSLFFLPQVALGQNQVESSLETKNVVVEEGEIIDHDFFAAGETVTISGVINGDAFLAGGNISVDGKINGDLLAAGGMVTLSGEVTDDVRVGGGNILINGPIGKNLTVGGGNVTVTKEAKIEGSLLAFSGNITVNSSIGRDAQVFAGQATFGNQIGGNLKGMVENLTLTSGAQVLGNLEYESSQKAVVAKGATVSGKIVYKPSEKRPFTPGRISSLRDLEKVIPKTPAKETKAISRFKFISFIINFILGLVFIAIFPKRAAGMVKTLRSKPWISLGVGFITPIVFSLIMVLLTISLIGIPLALVLIPLFGFLVYFSKVFTAIFLGNKILPRLNISKSHGWSLFIGLLAYYLLRMIPVVKTLTILGFGFFGLGAFILDQKSLRRKPTRKARASKEP